MIFVQEDESCVQLIQKVVSDKYLSLFEKLLKARDFKGKKSQVFTFSFEHAQEVAVIICVGLGKKQDKKISIESYSQAVARAIRASESLKLEKIALLVPGEKDTGLELHELVQKAVINIHRASYAFDTFVTDTHAKIVRVQQVIVVIGTKDKKVAQNALELGEIIGKAINSTRLWVDLPANIMSTHECAQRAEKLAKENKLACTIFDEAQVEKLGMGGIKAVGMGSQHDAMLVILEYKAKKKNAPTIALVGKGITFDSGGLNIKPTGYMETMKEDMAGAAAVIHAIVALAQLEVDCNIIALAPLAENMVSGSANHPGDIIRFYNGKTAIVGNTDAEGRLVLADALAYAEKEYKTRTDLIKEAIQKLLLEKKEKERLKRVASELWLKGEISGTNLKKVLNDEEIKDLKFGKSWIEDMLHEIRG